MSDTHVAPGSEGAAAPAATPASEVLTPREAHLAYTARRERESKAPEKTPEVAPEVAAPDKLPEKADDAQPETVDPVETTKEDDAQAEPDPIDPPRSWTKEAKERWQSLPRETQEYLSSREQERDREVRRSQNEAADKLKSLTAKEQLAEQVRQQYEQALPALLQTMNEQQQGEFSDIKTMADVKNLAETDWPRYAKWDAQQKQIAAVAQEAKAAQERQSSEFESKWSAFATEQDQKLIELAPELADKSRAGKIADSAVSVLKDIGFSEQELGQLWNGKASVSLRDHRVQLLILDGVKYREAKAAPPKAAPKPVPQVQKPGVAQPKGAASDANEQTLRNKLHSSGTVDDAFALYKAKRKAG